MRNLTVDLFTQLRMFPVSFIDHYALFCLFFPVQPPKSRCYVLLAGWRAVFTGDESFSTLCVCSASSRTGVARQQRARPHWRWPFSAASRLFEDPFTQERTQLGDGVMKFSFV